MQAENLAFGEVYERAAGRCGQGFCNQLLGAGDVDNAGVGHLIEDAERVQPRQEALHLGGLWIECQRTLNPVDRFGQAATCRRF